MLRDEISQGLCDRIKGTCFDCGGLTAVGSTYCAECLAPTRCVVIHGEAFALPEDDSRFQKGSTVGLEQCDECGCDEYTVAANGVVCTGAHYFGAPPDEQDREGCGRLFRFETREARKAVWS